MKKDYLHLVLIVDESGSMSHIRKDTVGGLDSLIKEQKEAKGEVTVTTSFFNSRTRSIHNFAKIEDVGSYEQVYRPSGYTALLDSVGTTIDSVGKVLADMKEEDRPSKVMVVISTDGQENCSQEFTKEAIREKIKHQQDVYSWEFVFIGANQDSFAEAGKLGIGASSTMNYAYSNDGAHSAYASISRGVLEARTCDFSKSFCFDDSDRKIQDELIAK